MAAVLGLVTPRALETLLTETAARIEGAVAPAVSLASAEPAEVVRFTASMFAGVLCSGATQAVEDELKAAVLRTLGLGAEARCALAASGTETMILAFLAAKRTATVAGRGKVVASDNAHPSLVKAARLLDLDIVLTPSRGGLADPRALEAAIDDRTILLAASAPSWGAGRCDPLEALADLAARRGLPLHLDACIGGMLYPFSDPERAAAFAHPAVASISVDLHKFGYGPYTLAAACFARPELADAASFSFDDWDGFPYRAESLAGDRPFWPVAGSWAVMRGLGDDGYRALADRLGERLRRTTDAAVAAGHVLAAEPESFVVCLRGRGDLADRLKAGGLKAMYCPRPDWVRIRLLPLQDDAGFERTLSAL